MLRTGSWRRQRCCSPQFSTFHRRSLRRMRSDPTSRSVHKRTSTSVSRSRSTCSCTTLRRLPDSRPRFDTTKPQPSSAESCSATVPHPATWSTRSPPTRSACRVSRLHVRCGRMPSGHRLRSQSLERVTVRLQPTTAGHLVVSLDQLKFVDLQGNTVDVDVPVHEVAIDVGSAAGAPTFAATPVGVALTIVTTGRVRESSAVTSRRPTPTNWRLRGPMPRRFETCTVAGASDANGDGCLDIADVQRMAGAESGAATAQALPPRLEVPGVPWVVNTINDLPDSNIGNGKCVTSAGDCSLRAGDDS